MIGQKFRVGLFALTLLSLSAQPASAFCHWWKSCCGAPATSTYYAPAPVIANYAPACPQTVSYVPQTAYRTVYYNAPVVTYSPVAACGPCGQTTVMRPVTTYVTQARLVPYTMYRPVVAAMPVSPCATGCGAPAPVAAAAYYAPYAPAPAPCCGANYGANYGGGVVTAGYASAPVMAAPPAGVPGAAVPSLVPTPVQGQNVTPAYPGPSASPPTQTPDPGQQPRTFEDGQQNGQPQSRIVLPPRNSNTSGAPRALDPEDALDQSTALPIRNAVAVRPVSKSTPKSTAVKADDGGWRAARD